MLAQEATAATSSNLEPGSPYGHSFTICIFTALAILVSYALLLMISISYIKIVIFPVIMLVFILAVHCKWKGNRVETTENLVLWVALAFMMQLLCVGKAKFVGQQNDNFVISDFLLFFSSAFGALTLMIATVPIGSGPGVAKASQVFRMTFMVVLLMTVHTKAAEWVGKDMILVCMPELIAALAWFTIHFDNGSYTICIDNVISRKSGVLVLSAAMVLLSLTVKFADERKVLAKYWNARVLGSCTISGVLSYISMWMIPQQCQLFKSTYTMDVLIKLLEFSAYSCFLISAVLVAMRTGLDFFGSDQSIRIPVVDPGLGNFHTEAAMLVLVLVLVVILYSLFLCMNVIIMGIPKEDQGRRRRTFYYRSDIGSKFIELIPMVTSVIAGLLIEYLVTKAPRGEIGKTMFDV